ncbi:Isoaspartyl peptidase [Ceratocystis fimbriata CBS 114723]|uniref:Isoaspartyl peptidase n=1 Tax=Ceratocystis fimbriata CBS 114723 TaxID=1035309 RepID=A0A2C5WW59_9PEZI|nr:Isoaspartyl peptidase [Ceratocystis fimbriata CBS 114723]
MNEKMEYYAKPGGPVAGLAPRVIIQGGAGNITPTNMPEETYREYRSSLLDIICRTNKYMTTPCTATGVLPSALKTAVFAVSLLEDNALFNSGHGAVFTRDGINELEASVMVSRGFHKRTVGVLGLQHVRNPVKLAAAILEHGDIDLDPSQSARRNDSSVSTNADRLDIPSGQGHTMFHGATAEQLAADYKLDLVHSSYFFTQKRWDEHQRGLQRERLGGGSAHWSSKEYVPQGTCGAVAMDATGMVCAATSTGGLTNKLTGRLGDTPTPGAGFWAEEWQDTPQLAAQALGLGEFTGAASAKIMPTGVSLSSALLRLLTDCLPTPFVYMPVASSESSESPGLLPITISRSMGTSGTGNGDSFLRIAAGRTVGALARFRPLPTQSALSAVSGRGGALQQSAGDRFGRTGEGEGGMVGIESVVVRRGEQVVYTRTHIVQDHNCGGMFRAWIDDDGKAIVRVFNGEPELGDSIQAMEVRQEEVTQFSGVGDDNPWMRIRGYRSKDVR